MVTRVRLAAVSAAVLTLFSATVVTPAVAQGASGPPTVVATVTSKTITFSHGTSVHAGRVTFKVVAPSGDHTLQLAKLTPGYSLRQAGADLAAAFSGKVSAVRTIDKKILFLGGAEATPNHPGYFAETLYAGTYYAFDQNGNAITTLHVFGTPPMRDWVHETSTITATNAHRFATSPTVLPASGWTLFRNAADEPHFIVFQQVQPTTTAKMVSDYLASGNQNPPPWGLPGTTSTGVISPGRQILFHHQLPAGSYVILCYWPDDQTGMPHALMGMWKLVTLK